jgi:soluble lytic murein transglycosylase
MFIFKKYLAGLVFLFLLTLIPQTNALAEGDVCSRDEEREAFSLVVAQYMADTYGPGREKQWESLAKTLCEESERYAVDYRMVMAIMKVESNFRFKAASRDGARGIMQLKVPLAKSMARVTGEPYRGRADLFDPHKNIKWGICHLSRLAKDYSSAEAVLYAYNVGCGRAKRTISRNGKPKTAFVRRVMKEYDRYLSILPEATPREEPVELTI